MLLSMTGFGDARRQGPARAVSVEARTVNNRFLKCSVRLPDVYGTFEGEIEKLVRAKIARGTVNVTVRIERLGEQSRYRIDQTLLAAYVEQAQAAAMTLGMQVHDLNALLTLPGVVTERVQDTFDPADDWPLVAEATTAAIASLDTFRRTEGAAMADELRANLQTIATELDGVAALAPAIIRDYRDRLHERVAELLRGTNASVGDSDLIREVSLFADRSDINEELTRLRSHLSQFESFIADEQSQGRKLEFLTQELGREVNTIGSKANNVAIAHRVVEMKAAVEKIREILANIE